MAKQTYHFAAAAMEPSVAVDRENGIIKGVTVITGGIQAKGHNLEVDDTTLDQMLACGQSKGKAAVKWNHKTGADAVNGFHTNFRIEGEKLKADWHLLKTHPGFEHALELAERMPEALGFSASFSGQSELKDGTKVFNPDAKTKFQFIMKGGKRLPVPAGAKIFARCDDLISVDLVATPAANPDGMFSAEVDSGGNDMADKLPGTAPENELDAASILLGEFRQFAASVNTRLSALEEPDEDDDADQEEEEEEEAAAETPATGFKSIGQVLHYFEARLDQAASDQERKEFTANYQALEAKVGDLLDVNEQLLSENAILAEAYQELSAKTKTVVEFSAGTDGQTRPVTRSTGGKKLTEFEARVEALKAEGKSVADAMCFAVDEDTERYQRHLEAKQTFAQTL